MYPNSLKALTDASLEIFSQQPNLTIRHIEETVGIQQNEFIHEWITALIKGYIQTTCEGDELSNILKSISKDIADIDFNIKYTTLMTHSFDEIARTLLDLPGGSRVKVEELQEHLANAKKSKHEKVARVIEQEIEHRGELES